MNDTTLNIGAGRYEDVDLKRLDRRNAWSSAAFVTAVLAAPAPFMGVIPIALGAVAHLRRERPATIAIVFAIIATLTGMTVHLIDHGWFWAES